MQIKQISYKNPMDRYYFQSFFDNFLSKTEDVDLTPDFGTFMESISNPTARMVWSCMVMVDGTDVKGGITMGYLPRVQSAIIMFAQVEGGDEKLLDQLLDAAITALHVDYPGMQHIYVELTNEEISMAAWANKVCVLDFPYLAPAIKSGGKAVDYLHFAVVGEKVPGMYGEDIVKVLREYFDICYVDEGGFEYCIPEFAEDEFIEAV